MMAPAFAPPSQSSTDSASTTNPSSVMSSCPPLELPYPR